MFVVSTPHAGEPQEMAEFRERVIDAALEQLRGRERVDVVFWSVHPHTVRTKGEWRQVTVLFAAIHLQRSIFVRVGHVAGDPYPDGESIGRRSFAAYVHHELARGLKQEGLAETELGRFLSHATSETEVEIATLAVKIASELILGTNPQTLAAEKRRVSGAAVHKGTGIVVAVQLDALPTPESERV